MLRDNLVELIEPMLNSAGADLPALCIHNQKLDEPKREKSKGAIPVIAQLRLFLERHRARSGNPRQGYILQSPQGKPLNLDALAKDVIRPAFEAPKLPWYGWHAFRRGLATNLNRLGVPDKVIQQILRHANVTTTMNIYVKMVSPDAEVAMKRPEANLTMQQLCSKNTAAG